MALAYGNGFISNGLVHLVDASNMKSFPGAGTTWFDLSGNNRNGTLNNGLLWGAGNGGAISFDGSNDYVSFPNDIYSTLTTTTFSVWFYLNGTSTWQRVYDFGRGQALNIFFTPNSRWKSKCKFFYFHSGDSRSQKMPEFMNKYKKPKH